MNQSPETEELDDTTREILYVLIDEMKETKNALSYLKKEEDRIKRDILVIVNKYSLPIQEGKSSYMNLPNDSVALRVTRGETNPQLCAMLLLEQVKDPEVFLRVISVKSIELNEKEWRIALDKELVTNSMLDLAILPSTERSLTIAITGRKEEYE